MRRSVQRHFLQDTEVKRCMLVHLRPNDLRGPRASSSGPMTKTLCFWNWKSFSRISDPDRDPDSDPYHVKNVVGSF